MIPAALPPTWDSISLRHPISGCCYQNTTLARRHRSETCHFGRVQDREPHSTARQALQSALAGLLKSYQKICSSGFQNRCGVGLRHNLVGGPYLLLLQMWGSSTRYCRTLPNPTFAERRRMWATSPLLLLKGASKLLPIARRGSDLAAPR